MGLEKPDSNELLRKLCLDKFKEFCNNGLIPDKEKKKYAAQVKLELDTYKELHFTDYVLLIWKIIEKAKSEGVFIDHGRGSCVSSIVFYLLEITRIDPIKNGLFFSRFVSKTRSKFTIDENNNIFLQADLVPDADLNLGEGRPVVLEWLHKLYPNRICKILTMGKLAGRILIKDVSKIVLDYSEDQAQFLSDLIEMKHGIIESTEDTYNRSPEFKEWADTNPTAYKIALKLQDLYRQKGVHASGYLVCRDELLDTMPYQMDSEGARISSYTMKYVPAIKVDLLGLTTNTIIRNVLDASGEKLSEINLDDDPFIYQKFQDGKLLPYGLYQISQSCAYRVCKRVKPVNLSELSAVNAIARPGALAYEDAYVNNTGESPHPIFNEDLNWTRFQPLFQEQAIKLAMRLGFSADEGETLRRIIGKKLVKEIPIWKEKIYAKCKKNNIPTEAADAMWKLVDESSKYSFNLSHSAATSAISALTVYLKYKYPLLWFVECLKVGVSQEEVGQIAHELAKFNIKLLPPDLIKSEINFKIEDGNIRFGLSAIKGLKNKTPITTFCKYKFNFKNKLECFDAAKTSKINIGALSSLIQAGALGTYPGSRSRLVLEAQTYNLLKPKEKAHLQDLFEVGETDVLAGIKKLTETNDENGKPFIKDTRFKTIKKSYDGYKTIYQLNSRNENLASWMYEFLLLGSSYSENLKSIYQKVNPTFVAIGELSKKKDNERVMFAGIVGDDIVKRKSSKGNQYVRMNVVDETGSVNTMIFDGKQGNIERIKEENGGKLPEEGDLVVVSARTKDGAVFVNDIATQSNKIYMRLQQLKDSEDEE
jgi:DNA polymerase-3 subunit alpha